MCQRPFVDHSRRQRRRPARRTRRRAPTSTAGRWTASSKTDEKAQTRLRRPRSTRTAQTGRDRRDGLPHAERHPELLDVRAATSCCRTTCSSRSRRGACPSTSSWCRMVGDVHARTTSRAAARTSSSTRTQAAARRREAPAGSAGTRRSTRGPTSRTCCTSSNVSWGYYVVTGNEPDCQNDSALACAPVRQNAGTPGIWNPLPYFDTVNNDNQRGNIQSVSNFYNAAKTGTLPAVSWVVPSAARERAPAVVDQRRAVIRHEPHQRGDEQPRLELDRDLPRVGRLGRLLRPRRAARRRRERLRAARARHGDQPLRQARATSTTRRSASTRTPSSSRTTSSAASGSIPRPTGGPTRGPTCARTSRSSATSPTTSTSRSRRARRCCCRSHPTTTLTPTAPFAPLAPSARPGTGRATVLWRDRRVPTADRRSTAVSTPYLAERRAAAPVGLSNTSTTQTHRPGSRTVRRTRSRSRRRTRSASAIRPFRPAPSASARPLSRSRSRPHPATSPRTCPGTHRADLRLADHRLRRHAVRRLQGTDAPDVPIGGDPGDRHRADQRHEVHVRGRGAERERQPVPRSDSSNEVTVGTPVAPTDVTAVTAGAGAVTVAWKAPPIGSGAQPTGYIVYPYIDDRSQGGRVFNTKATPRVIETCGPAPCTHSRSRRRTSSAPATGRSARMGCARPEPGCPWPDRRSMQPRAAGR